MIAVSILERRITVEDAGVTKPYTVVASASTVQPVTLDMFSTKIFYYN